MEFVKIEKQIHVKEYTTTGPVIRLNGEPDYQEEGKVYKQDEVSHMNEEMFGKINPVLKSIGLELMLLDKECIKQVSNAFHKKYVAGFAIINEKKSNIWILCFDKKGDFECRAILPAQKNNE